MDSTKSFGPAARQSMHASPSGTNVDMRTPKSSSRSPSIELVYTWMTLVGTKKATVKAPRILYMCAVAFRVPYPSAFCASRSFHLWRVFSSKSPTRPVDMALRESGRRQTALLHTIDRCAPRRTPSVVALHLASLRVLLCGEKSSDQRLSILTLLTYAS